MKKQISDFTGKYQGSCFFMIRTQNVNQHIMQARCRELMKKYQDLPMDLADGSLVVLAESKNLEKIFTYQSHCEE
jgi:predicted nucleic acid-binding protein